MTVNLVSPGIVIREVDLTRGRVDATSQVIGAIAGPFEKGPVEEPVLINSEDELLSIFGPAKDKDEQSDYWLSASTYLSYGGALKVIRAGSSDLAALRNSNANGIGITDFSTNIVIKSNSDYEFGETNSYIFASRNPGSWANGLKICAIDNLADQIIVGVGGSNTVVDTITTLEDIIELEDVSISANTNVISGINTSQITTGMYVESLVGVLAEDTEIVSVGSSSIILSNSTINQDIQTRTLRIGTQISTEQEKTFEVTVGMGITQNISGRTIFVDGDPVVISGYLRGIVTEVKQNEISVKVTDRVDENGVSHHVDYRDPGSTTSLTSYSFNTFLPFFIGAEEEVEYSISEYGGSIVDWYNNQVIEFGSKVIPWRTIAPKPGTSQYGLERDSKNDELHIVVIDGSGGISGISGQILEKHLFISKAIDGKVSPARPTYFKDFIFTNSNYIFVSSALTELKDVDIRINPNDSSDFELKEGADWSSLAQGNSFKCIGPITYTLNGGKDYSGVDYIGGYDVSTSDVINAYKLLENETSSRIDFIICGPSGGPTIENALSKANALVAIAEKRKDCIVTISPFKKDIINLKNSNQQTEKIIQFFGGIQSSSYAVFNSGYKYTLDRFNNKFMYLSCSADIAGIMARTVINNLPWFSPAGESRGVLKDVIKLAYNPSPIQRDQLYSNRINAVTSLPGSGTILYGDKTALSYPSAFDRINVRMLFLTIEKAIESAARAQLFEFNDIITRNNFINIVEPYLREVSAKRGITEFLVVCDESNNPPEVIDANEFRADIFVKPERSINFIELTFVATRTGIAFSEVVGTV